MYVTISHKNWQNSYSSSISSRDKKLFSSQKHLNWLRDPHIPLFKECQEHFPQVRVASTQS
jgi:hypothetical protein